MCDCDATTSLNLDGVFVQFLFKVTNRLHVIRFMKNNLNMRILRIEQTAEDCADICKTPNSTTWSKTTLGYAAEEHRVCLQVAYNYTNEEFDYGNGLVGITVNHHDYISPKRHIMWPLKTKAKVNVSGFVFNMHPSDKASKDNIAKISIASKDPHRSARFWGGLLGMKAFSTTRSTLTMGFSPKQTKLEFVLAKNKIRKVENSGILIFACPKSQLSMISTKIEQTRPQSLVNKSSLSPPIDESIEAVVIKDPDGHLVCFYALEQYMPWHLSADEDAEKMLEEQLKLEEKNVCAMGCVCPNEKCHKIREAKAKLAKPPEDEHESDEDESDNEGEERDDAKRQPEAKDIGDATAGKSTCKGTCCKTKNETNKK